MAEYVQYDPANTENTGEWTDSDLQKFWDDINVNVTAQRDEAMDWQEQYAYDPGEVGTLSERLDTVLSDDSKYIQRARTRAEEESAAKGMLHSSMAAGAAEGAAIDRGLEVAKGDVDVDKFNIGAQTESDAARYGAAGVLGGAAQQAQGQQGLIGAEFVSQEFLNKQQFAQEVEGAAIKHDYDMLIKQADQDHAILLESLQQEGGHWDTYLEGYAQIAASEGDPIQKADALAEWQTQTEWAISQTRSYEAIDITSDITIPTTTPTTTTTDTNIMTTPTEPIIDTTDPLYGIDMTGAPSVGGYEMPIINDDGTFTDNQGNVFDNWGDAATSNATGGTTTTDTTVATTDVPYAEGSSITQATLDQWSTEFPNEYQTALTELEAFPDFNILDQAAKDDLIMAMAAYAGIEGDWNSIATFDEAGSVYGVPYIKADGSNGTLTIYKAEPITLDAVMAAIGTATVEQQTYADTIYNQKEALYTKMMGHPFVQETDAWYYAVRDTARIAGITL